MVRNFRKQQTCMARALSRALTTWNTQNYDTKKKQKKKDGGSVGAAEQANNR
jgi:hypothetical protein